MLDIGGRSQEKSHQNPTNCSPLEVSPLEVSPLKGSPLGGSPLDVPPLDGAPVDSNLPQRQGFGVSLLRRMTTASDDLLTRLGRQKDINSPPRTFMLSSSFPPAAISHNNLSSVAIWRDLAERDRNSARSRRQTIGVLKCTRKTLRLFCGALKYNLIQVLKWLRAHLLMMISIIAILLIFNTVAFVAGGVFASCWRHCGYLIRLAVWWVSLGAISSIGLGSGVHTGILFVFPHNFMITQASEECNNLSFDPSINMWGLFDTKGRTFACREKSPEDLFFQNVTLVGLVLKALPYSFLWGLGTAIGELPPYAAGFAASKAALIEEAHQSSSPITLRKMDQAQPEKISETSQWLLLKKNLLYGLVRFVETFGGLAVFLLSCWPNAFFDLCGIICGQSLMPFWKFFIPLVLGKAVVKVFIQTTGTIFLLSKTCDRSRAKLIAKLAKLPPLSALIRLKFGSTRGFEEWIVDKIQTMRRSGLSEMETKSSVAAVSTRRGIVKWMQRLTFARVMSFVVYVILFYFSIDIIDQLAISQQRRMDYRDWNEKWADAIEEESEGKKAD